MNEIKKKYFLKTKTHEINSYWKQERAKEQKETQDKKVTGIIKQKQLREKIISSSPAEVKKLQWMVLSMET